jgi:hypothetical protein
MKDLLLVVKKTNTKFEKLKTKAANHVRRTEMIKAVSPGVNTGPRHPKIGVMCMI